MNPDYRPKTYALRCSIRTIIFKRCPHLRL